MRRGVKTVFFGPFVGEFGWELLSWHGWVKRLCRGRYAGYHKIACSFPSRYPFYPDVDEFWPLPKKFLKNPISSRGYITDCWTKSFPRPDNKPFNLPEVMPLVDNVIKDFKKKLPKNTKFIIPWGLRYDKEDEIFYGVSIPKNPKSDKDFITYNIPPSNQILEKLQPTPRGLKILKTRVNPKKQLISIFPRHRLFRRPDKNWGRGKYETLIHTLQREFPQFKLAILGEPGGAFFADGDVPQGCIDLIRIDQKYRLDVQIAALKQSVLAIGSQSGGTVLSLLAGCPTLTWGGAIAEKGFRKGNYLQSKLVFYPSLHPPVNTIVGYAKWMLGYGKTPYRHEIKRFALTSLFYFIPHFIQKSRPLVKIKESLKLGF